MVIKQVYTTVLSFPTAHYIGGWRPVTRTFHLVTFLLTDDNLIGVGEGTPYSTSVVDDYAKTLFLARKIQELSLEDALDVLRSSEYSEFRRREQVNYGAFLALESAVMHALAQSKKKYEAEVLGGVYRTKIPVAYTIFLGHPVIMSRRLEEAIKLGYKHVKFKIPCNLEELKRVVEALHSVRKQYSGEETVLRADANECFPTFEKAEKALSIMERHGVNIVEQPMPRDRLRDIAELRKRFYPAIEMMLDESLRKPSDVELFAQMEVADIVNFHPSKLGCLSITREAILKTQEMGMKANIGSALMTDIGLFHYLSLASSIPRLDYPLEEIGLSNFYGYSILTSPPKITEGYFSLQDINVTSLDFYSAKKFKIEKTVFFKEQVAHIVRKVLDTVM